MAITFELAKATPNCLEYLATQDGNAGVTATLTVALLQGDAVAGALKNLLDNPTLASKGVAIGALTQTDARRALQGDASTDADQDLSDIPHCYVTITIRGVAAAGAWAADGNVPGSQDGYQLIVQSPSDVSVAYVKIEFQHTLVR